MNLSDDNESRSRRRHSRLLATAGLLLVLAGPISYVPLMEVPFFRGTGLSIWVLGLAGAALAWRATRHHAGRGVKTVAMICVVLPLAFAVLLFGLSSLPDPAANSPIIASSATAPDFELLNQNGEPVALGDLRRFSMVLLVFYRGHW